VNVISLLEQDCWFQQDVVTTHAKNSTLLMMVLLADVGILHVVGTDRVTNAETKRRTITRDIVRVSHVRKCIWGGHVARMGQIRLGALMWDVRTGKRRTG
jgi:hypothetical protein